MSEPTHEPASQQPGILVTNGPYVLEGDVSVVRRRIVESDAGESTVWETTVRVDEHADGAALCRCGGSANKPFCDGTHNRNGFDGACADREGTYDERSKVVGTDPVVVRDDRSICVHAGFCTTKATNAWRLARGEASEDAVARAALTAMIERCPSGALTYRLDEDGPDVEQELPRQVSGVDDGPLVVTGGVTMRSADGTALEMQARTSLCRCGASNAKPYCDGSHAEAGFRDSAGTVEG
jgi:CDGSH-type Zn-finger protein